MFQTPNAQVAFKLIDDGDYSRFFSIDSNGVVMTTQQLVVPRRDFNVSLLKREKCVWMKICQPSPPPPLSIKNKKKINQIKKK